MTQFESLGLRGVIFDMDGLLFDTESLYMEAWPHVGRAMGFSIPMEVAKRTIARPRAECELMLQALYGPSFSMEEAHGLLGERVRSHLIENGMPLKPGAEALLSLLHKRDIPVALGTSNRLWVAKAYLEHAGLLPYFGPLVTGDMVEHVKPAPDIFLKAASEMGLQPDQCLVLDDSPTGITAAYRAGCRPAMVPDLLEPTAETLGQVWRIFKSLEEVPDVLFL